ncbi:MAG TPA: GNAT family N-acetyltransferase [Bacteroidota bacterium]|nr:GNAT family N-acetyltransferase [Bacteroidota bacterium]
MIYLSTRLRNLWFLISRAHFSLLLRKIATRIYSNRYSYGLRRDLRNSIGLPEEPFALTIRPLTPVEVSTLLEVYRSEEDPNFDLEIIDRMEHVHADIPTCYGAFNEEGDLVFIQWLMGPDQNERIQSYFNSIYPVLAEGEALLENALTLNGYRGHGVMGAAVARIAEIGKTRGVHTVITFVAEENEPSLRGCRRAGFLPYLLRHERWVMFRRKLEFTKLSGHSGWPAEFLD